MCANSLDVTDEESVRKWRDLVQLHTLNLSHLMVNEDSCEFLQDNASLSSLLSSDQGEQSADVRYPAPLLLGVINNAAVVHPGPLECVPLQQVPQSASIELARGDSQLRLKLFRNISALTVIVRACD